MKKSIMLLGLLVSCGLQAGGASDTGMASMMQIALLQDAAKASRATALGDSEVKEPMIQVLGGEYRVNPSRVLEALCVASQNVACGGNPLKQVAVNDATVKVPMRSVTVKECDYLVNAVHAAFRKVMFSVVDKPEENLSVFGAALEASATLHKQYTGVVADFLSREQTIVEAKGDQEWAIDGFLLKSAQENGQLWNVCQNLAERWGQNQELLKALGVENIPVEVVIKMRPSPAAKK